MIRVTIGGLVLVLTLVPVYRVLADVRTGLAGRATVALSDIAFDSTWTGLLLVVPIGILGAVFRKPQALQGSVARVTAFVLWPRASLWFAGWAVVGGSLTTAFSLLVLEGRPNLTDAFVQFLHARYWANGLLAGPNDGLGAFWAVQNSLFTDNGWVSQYPPGHVALLALFLWFGLPWLLGPLLVATTVLSAGALMDRLYPDDPALPRLAVMLLALSPFFLFLSGTYMNHVTAAACVTLGVHALFKAWEDAPRWALLAGAALAFALATRPLSTLAVTVAFALVLACLWRQPVGRAAKCCAWGFVGAAPVLTAWFIYNNHFFGSPFRLGYTASHGHGMALGFHRDPWGNLYGLREAIGYTSSDLIALGTHLFEAPLSAVVVIGVFLIVARSLERGTWLLLALAVAPVLANLLYWHHGLFMGPRMLHEAAPAWALLFVVAAVGLARRVSPSTTIAGRYHAQPAVAMVLLVSVLVGIVFMAPLRARSYSGSWMAMDLPVVQEPAIVFVHDAWAARIMTTLTSAGIRLDAAETLLRQNSTCHVHSYAAAVERGDQTQARAILALLDTIPRAEREIPQEDGVRRSLGATITAECARQWRADQHGVADITPLLWQAELHGDSSANGTLIARDLGPERNSAMLSAHPYRTVYVYIGGRDEVVMAYDVAMRLLWAPSASDLPNWPG